MVNTRVMPKAKCIKKFIRNTYWDIVFFLSISTPFPLFFSFYFLLKVEVEQRSSQAYPKADNIKQCYQLTSLHSNSELNFFTFEKKLELLMKCTLLRCTDPSNFLFFFLSRQNDTPFGSVFWKMLFNTLHLNRRAAQQAPWGLCNFRTKLKESIAVTDIDYGWGKAEGEENTYCTYSQKDKNK